jgi:hypothetical protein
MKFVLFCYMMLLVGFFPMFRRNSTLYPDDLNIYLITVRYISEDNNIHCLPVFSWFKLLFKIKLFHDSNSVVKYFCVKS